MMALLSKRYLDVPLDNSNSNSPIVPLGLTQSQRTNRLTIYGANELTQPPERSLLSFIIDQFDDKLVRILLVVACASGMLGLLELKEDVVRWASSVFTKGKVVTSTSIASEVVEEAKAKLMGAEVNAAADTTAPHEFGWSHILEALVEPIVISTILVINALVGGYQSLNASKGISALKAMQASKAVLRMQVNHSSAVENNNEARVEEVEVDASTLVPGDVVILSVGQKVPADIRLLSVSTSTFTVDEASLTGESDSVPKTPYLGEVIVEEDYNKGHVMDDLDEIQEGAGSMGKHANGMLYSGTVITAGKGVGVVVRTGMSTEMGKVSVF
jgi:magnesium-transporting ATPase (P-type)